MAGLYLLRWHFPGVPISTGTVLPAAGRRDIRPAGFISPPTFRWVTRTGVPVIYLPLRFNNGLPPWTLLTHHACRAPFRGCRYLWSILFCPTAFDGDVRRYSGIGDYRLYLPTTVPSRICRYRSATVTGDAVTTTGLIPILRQSVYLTWLTIAFYMPYRHGLRMTCLPKQIWTIHYSTHTYNASFPAGGAHYRLP